MKKSILPSAIILLLMFGGEAQTVTDIDGNTYNTITIGTQVWTQENLKVTHYRNGDPILNETDSAQWCVLSSGAFCRYDNDANTANIYGLLYNWFAVSDPRNLAMEGWHVPTYSDFETLQVFLDYDLVAGGKLKEVGTAHWMSPNTGANNESEFTALPGGQRADSFYSCMFMELTTQGYWWSSSEMDATYPWGINISYDSEGMTNWAASKKQAGFSVRLINDLAVGLNKDEKKEELHIYPNPASDRIFVQAADFLNPTLVIYNLLGEPVLQRTLQSRKEVLDIRSLAAGVYVIRLKGDGRTVQCKLNKQ